MCPTPSPAPVSMQHLVESLCECRLELRLVRWVEGSEAEGSEVEGSEVRPTQSSACLFSLIVLTTSVTDGMSAFSYWYV